MFDSKEKAICMYLRTEYRLLYERTFNGTDAEILYIWVHAMRQDTFMGAIKYALNDMDTINNKYPSYLVLLNSSPQL